MRYANTWAASIVNDGFLLRIVALCDSCALPMGSFLVHMWSSFLQFVHTYPALPLKLCPCRGAFHSFLVRSSFDHAYSVLTTLSEGRSKPLLGMILRLNEVLAIRPPPPPEPQPKPSGGAFSSVNAKLQNCILHCIALFREICHIL
jgi:hypothetical protein